MFPFCNFGPFDRSELRALLAAAFSSVIVIAFLMDFRPRNANSAPVPAHTKPVRPSGPPGDSFAAYRIKPEQFYNIDFWNYSYGSYILRDGKKIQLALLNSQLELPDNSDSFSLRDVYYTDVTGDGDAEAIAWLSHVHCAGTCDGGSHLFYIYTVKDGKLKPIWQYETGSYENGCGLKSLTISGRHIVVELFGHCTGQKLEDRSQPKFMATDSTFILQEFDGRAFREQSSEIVETSETRVEHFEPGIRIF